MDDQPQHWHEENSAEFIDYGKYFVPEREVQIETICDLIPPPPPGAHLLELCCGEGLLCRALLERFPASSVHAIDGSPRMVETARSLLSGLGGRFDAQLAELSDRAWRSFPWPLHAVVSSLAIHHLDGAQKRALFRDMHQALAPGGVLVIADLILPAAPPGFQVAGKAWDRAVRDRSLALGGDLRAFEEFERLRWNSFSDTEPDPVDKPSTLLDQLKWMEEAGFTAVDVAWMRAGHVIFGGTKLTSAV